MFKLFRATFPLLILPITLAYGQTFEDCSNDFNTQFKKISLQRTLKEIPEKTADSLIQIIETNLNGCIVGKEIPDVELIGISGKRYTKEDLKGKVVMLNFWSINCGPCIIEIPVLNKIQESYKGNDDFLFLSILIDKEEDLQKFLDKGLIKRKISFEVVPNAKPLIKSTFNLVKAFPTNLFIDREGKVFKKTIGGIVDSKFEDELELKLRAIIDSELNEQPGNF